MLPTNALRTVASAILASLALVVAPVAAAAPRQSPPVERLASSLRPADFEIDGKPAESLLVVHYHRPAGDYEGWNLWCWPEGGEGRASAFDRRDGFVRTAVVPFAATPARAGFLIRRGNWEAKDFDQDRFVALEQGRVTEIWTTSGDGAFTTDPSKVDLSLKVGDAFLDGPATITLALSRPLERAEERGLRVIDRTDPKRDFRVKDVRAARDEAAPRRSRSHARSQPTSSATSRSASRAARSRESRRGPSSPAASSKATTSRRSTRASARPARPRRRPSPPGRP